MLSKALSSMRVAPRGARAFSAAANPIGFELTDQQRQFQQLARDFAVNEMIPKAAE